MSVATQRIYSWATETAIRGPVSAETAVQAADQFRSTGNAQVWLLDASGATWIDNETVMAIRDQIDSLKLYGLDRIALVLPEIAKSYLPGMKMMLPIEVVSFDGRADAIAWLRRGCK